MCHSESLFCSKKMLLKASIKAFLHTNIIKRLGFLFGFVFKCKTIF